MREQTSSFSFPKAEHLKSRKLIDHLFEKGKSLNKFPFKLLWMTVEQDERYPVRVAFAVSSRKIKLAVKRNRIKRLMRESYRLNKTTLIDCCNKKQISLAMVIMYNGTDLIPHTETQEKIILLLHRLITLHEQTAE